MNYNMYHISCDLSHDSVVPHVLICQFARSVEFLELIGTGSVPYPSNRERVKNNKQKIT